MILEIKKYIYNDDSELIVDLVLRKCLVFFRLRREVYFLWNYYFILVF